jgi:HSP20 family protein
MTFTRWQNPLLEWPAVDHFQILRDELHDVLNRTFSSVGSYTPGSPAIDASEDAQNLYVRAELPGFKKEGIELTLHEGVLTLTGVGKDENKEFKVARKERDTDSFRRSVTLSSPVNETQIKAAFTDGVLTITLPKAEVAKPKQISLN